MLAAALTATLALGPSAATAQPSDGLNVTVNSANPMTQMMAMVLSMQAVKAHQKRVQMVLCGAAGDLALKETVTEPQQPAGKSPTQLLQGLIKSGAQVQVCPLLLPAKGLDEGALIEGIRVAKPREVAAALLDGNSQNASF